MAESESGQDKTEEPTDKRKKDSREKGEIARSKELNTVAVTLAGAGALMAFGGYLAETLMALMRMNFSLTREVVVDERYMAAFLLASGKMAIWAVQPVMLLLFVISFVAPIALGGFLFSGSLLQPKFSRMNPLSGIKRMFSLNALTELVKAMAKFFMILIVALVVLSADRQALLAIANEPLEQAIIHSVQVVGWSALWMAAGLLLIAAADVPFQLWQTHKKMKMTKQEVKDEYKDSEGKPEVKQRIRQLQREASQRRMMAAVPEADVIITNPTHYAVALQYDPEKGGMAPLLVAKGTDFVALKIREIGAEHNVQILESAALARAIYYSTELEQEIPAGLYLAVAQVLAFVFQVRQYRAGKGKPPEPLNKDLPIPEDLQRDS
ncbi:MULTISPECIES: flagellar biosynthesis protein FlhB [unclassified Pseudomonas]|jgi:flagellar biosynthetic protein FlhB|uniref:flagellar biosynthesis protein FlhB n=1 Tax=unclassified Pseudomonas TaxID=196821 RepID=UPI000C88873A|nr:MULTISPECIES: flagellar biosynthesis protein FlhB [unclassified Pseudomonas]MBI6954740.1 flagellar biosynthesis protein FlhB [Pseudomonas sp. CCOS 191]PMZ89097.1 flagellar biosynthesis protein FlhB [Pseudomonas sp. FW305-42]PNA19698.1 flagellar biosynthesis protein FlhB [Pseudomonas sp. MPR-R1B]PNB20227.1 flagellar biosynthesis protein FlhB [Pseudomonas sp. DP16D-E2]PNB40584.1 flagellar biosynthesis protein FlhB [Pseudomonas sp. FW305-17]